MTSVRPSPLRRLGVMAWVFLLASSMTVAPAAAVPVGYQVAAERAVATGVDHITIRRTEPAQVVHIGRVDPSSELALRTVLSADGGPERQPERTSSMCQRTECVLGVNGDFWQPGTGQPIGAVVSAGELIRSAIQDHAQLVISPEGGLTADGFGWSGRLLDADLRQLDVSEVNTGPKPSEIALYTPAFGPTTPGRQDVAELVLEVRRPEGAVRLDRTSVVRVVGDHEKGGNEIPAKGAVLSGQGKGAEQLLELARRVHGGATPRDALLRLESSPKASEAIGGSPVLLRDGQRAFPDDPTSFVRGRHPRTLVGRTGTGHTLLVTVDGRQPGYSEGMNLAEAADLMLELGAVDAINLDGGGSTTFVVGGEVVNRPSDRLVRRSDQRRISHVPQPGDGVVGQVERPVASSLLVMPAVDASINTPVRELLGTFDVDDMPAASTVATDPASDPSGHTPALVVHTQRDMSLLHVLAGALVTLALVLGPMTLSPVRRRIAAILHPK